MTTLTFAAQLKLEGYAVTVTRDSLVLASSDGKNELYVSRTPDDAIIVHKRIFRFYVHRFQHGSSDINAWIESTVRSLTR